MLDRHHLHIMGSFILKKCGKSYSCGLSMCGLRGACENRGDEGLNHTHTHTHTTTYTHTHIHTHPHTHTHTQNKFFMEIILLHSTFFTNKLHTFLFLFILLQ